MSKKRLPILFIVAAASLWLVGWFAMDVDLHLKQADATTSTAVRSQIRPPVHFETAHAANQTTMRILALDQAKRLTFWTLVLKGKKQTCNLVVRASYQGGLESGPDYWSVGCQNGNVYTMAVDAGEKDSVCTGNDLDPGT
ncbi:hypothetical protein [Bradyrhizobium sp. USDA 10063]